MTTAAEIEQAVEAINDRLAKKGIARDCAIGLGSGYTIGQRWTVYSARAKLCVFGSTMDEAVEAATVTIAELPEPWTHEQTGATLGIVGVA